MKLRIRSLESKQTHRIEVPNTCNLQQLKETIILQLSLFSSSSERTLLLSLNRKDVLSGSSPEETLQSIGLTSGDLVYFSQNPLAFSSQNPNLTHTQMEKRVENHDLGDTQNVESGKIDENREFRGTQMEKSSNLSSHSVNDRTFVNTQNVESVELVGGSSQSGELMDAQMEGLSKSSEGNDEGKNSGTGGRVEETEGADEMEVDDELGLEGDGKFSVPSFLKKVFVKEVGKGGGDHKLLMIAVHAVLVESGFVGYDPVSGKKVDGFHLLDGISLHYTLPEVSSSEVVETVVVKFQTLGQCVTIYGSLPERGFGVHRVCLDKARFVPALSFVFKNSDCTDSEDGSDGSMKMPNTEIFELWKIVKDGLSYPLLVDLCEKVGLVPPPCFMRLPTELKLKILESLPAVDLARVACVSSELRFVSSNNDLWRLKYEEEFGDAAGPQRECQWKARFSSAWEIRKKRKRVSMPYPWREPPLFRPLFPARRDPNPLGYPFIIGGDYDRFPSIGFPQNPGRRMFRFCDLGGGFGP